MIAPIKIVETDKPKIDITEIRPAVLLLRYGTEHGRLGSLKARQIKEQR